MSKLSEDRDYWHRHCVSLQTENKALRQKVRELEAENAEQADTLEKANVIADRIGVKVTRLRSHFGNLQAVVEAAKALVNQDSDPDWCLGQLETALQALEEQNDE